MKLIRHSRISSSISIFPSSLNSANRHPLCLLQLPPQNVRFFVPLVMRRPPIIERVAAKIIPSFRSSCVHRTRIMAGEATRGNQSDELQRKGIDEREEKENRVNLPPPPEKPLPGDCCGSGCVRCVWDEYYEQLEDYNRLCKDGTASSS